MMAIQSIVNRSTIVQNKTQRQDNTRAIALK